MECSHGKVTPKVPPARPVSGKEKKEGVMGGYILAFFKKQLENFASAKMLMFFIPMFITAVLMQEILAQIFVLVNLFQAKPDAWQYIAPLMEIATTCFISFCTFTVSLGSAILVCREVFKVQKLRALELGGEEGKEGIKSMGV